MYVQTGAFADTLGVMELGKQLTLTITMRVVCERVGCGLFHIVPFASRGCVA